MSGSMAFMSNSPPQTAQCVHDAGSTSLRITMPPLAIDVTAPRMTVE
jgi:hypothetical protein